ncbi:acyl-CoA N-acyltransferase [Myriangium duriaei CBS 260.36]|uniref:Acyl-CoA N-acyltransferase n=1 Tax=Myriangium duriaei CBS 260.36 TaxID=1168546 RepID=A0A9P4JCT9_9PEZI|nr:acyl-CoA N-acyltransferase [Myriangium duriaei CBS 260.36]
MPDTAEITIRPVVFEDLPQINAIQAYYVNHTTINFAYTPDTLEDTTSAYNKVSADGFPYLVAADKSEKVLGYAYVQSFRGRRGYQHSAELSIFVHPDATAMGIGTQLIQAILAELRSNKERSRLQHGIDPDVRGRDLVERLHGRTKRGDNIHQLLAIMTIDSDANKAGMLKGFYERHGFVETGILKEIGLKVGNWLSTRYMQVEI